MTLTQENAYSKLEFDEILKKFGVHIIFLYDTLNISNDNCSLIDEMTYNMLKQYYGRFNYKETITFQLVFMIYQCSLKIIKKIIIV